MKKRGFYFNTENNTYFYNDITGNVSHDLNKKSNSVSYGNESYINKTVTEYDVKNILDNIGCTQLILIVTEQCNLRCKYCVYSGEYDNNRTHSNNYMQLDTAKDVVRKYLENVTLHRKNDISTTATIGFFGGEPLLNFDLIQSIVEYSKLIFKGTINYTITTNATLLNADKIKFLVENNFSLIISLNGDLCENDRLRVYHNNSGTYNDIIEKLNMISNKYPSYFNTNVKVISTFDNGTDLFKLRDFFENNSLVKNKLAFASKIIDFHTNWYDQYSIIDNERYKLQVNELKKSFYNNLLNNNYIDTLSKKLFMLPYFNVLNRATNIELTNYKSTLQPFSGSCIPGSKIAVDHTGTLHMCEKVNNKTPIGTVEKWLDHTKISSLLNKYNKFLGKTCINCPVQRLCSICYKDIINIDGNCDFNHDTWCNTFIKDQIASFTDIYTLMESGITVSTLEKRLT